MAKKKKVFAITDAPLALTRDQAARQKKVFHFHDGSNCLLRINGYFA